MIETLENPGQPTHLTRASQTVSLCSLTKTPGIPCRKRPDAWLREASPLLNERLSRVALWGALAAFMVDNSLGTMIGCASILVPDAGSRVATADDAVHGVHLASFAWQVRPRLALPVDELDGDLDIEPPVLIRAHLRLGAKVLGPPAWDPDFNTADLPMMLRIQDLSARYRSHFPGV